MEQFIKYLPGLAATAVLAAISMQVSGWVPYHLISGSVFALLFGMLLHPVAARYAPLGAGTSFTAKKVLRLSIILMGLTLSFSQVFSVGKYSIFVMCFTLVAAFGGGYLLGRVLKIDWKLSSLISAGTGICGGSAIAAISPVIEARDEDVAYAISATFLFDVLMVILFPIAGRYFGMSDMGYGLWAGTAVNDTSSVVAAGYAFSDAAGAYSLIVKLTRTLSIIPTVLVFSLINSRIERVKNESAGRKKIGITQIQSMIPYFILIFLGMVLLKSTGIVPEAVSSLAARLSKFMMVMSLGAIGLNTNFGKMAKAGPAPMLHGFIISALVVVVSFAVQALLGQI